MENKDRVKCHVSVGSGDYPLESPCPRWSVVTRHGKPYCRQHDPYVFIDTAERMDMLAEAKRTLSRDTAIKLVEAAELALGYRESLAIRQTIQAAKQELGI